jgi:Uma2 family endonuclease
MSSATLISVEQFAAMPQDEAVQYELVEGELFEMPSATPKHAWIRDELCGAFRHYLSQKRLGVAVGEVDCQTGRESVRRPDVSFYRQERWSLVDQDRIPVLFAPDIAVEVLSPSEKAIDVNRKVHEYFAAGASEVWIIDTENIEIQIRTPSATRQLAAGDKLESPLLPGFSVDVSEALSAIDL